MPVRLIYNVLAWMLLIAGLVLPPAFPGIANAALLALSALALVLVFFQEGWRRQLLRPGIALPLVAAVLLFGAFAITAREPLHFLSVFYFAPLLVGLPVVTVFERADAISPERIGTLAAIGVMIAGGVALYDSFILGEMRAGSVVTNPIHFASVTLIVGFVALVGLRSANTLLRLFVLIAAALAFVAVVLSGSRGPLIAIPAIAAIAVAAVLSRLPRSQAIIGILGICALTAFAFWAAWQSGAIWRFTVFAELPQLLETGVTSDASTNERIQIYQAAWRAFLTSPLFGHGLGNIASAVRLQMPTGVTLADYQHLHNDLADFGVAAGVIGILAYGLILLAPALQAFRAPSNAPRMTVRYLAMVLVIGYLSMGLTNATFGILTQTTLYGFVLSLIVYLCRAETRATGSR